MTTFIVAIIIFINFLEYLVIFDVILSWLSLFGLRFRPKFMVDTLNPLYKNVQRYIPTRFGAFDFTPIVIILLLAFTRGLIILSYPEAGIAISQITRS